MDIIRRISSVVCMGLLLIGGVAGETYAYPAEVAYYFQGLDLDTGTVFTDPTMLIVVGGEEANQIEKILEPPPGIFPEFDPLADVYFEFDPAAGTSLVVIPDSGENPADPSHIVGLIVEDGTIEIPDISEYFSVPIGDSATVTFITEAGNLITTSITLNIRQENFGVVVDDSQTPIPEPSTLVFFGLGLAGLLGIRRRKKKRTRWLKRLMIFSLLLLLPGTFQPAAAQTFSCDDVSEIPKPECEALVALYNSTDGDNWTNNSGWLDTNTPCSWYGVGCSGGYVTILELRENELNGDIPPELSNLPDLQTLDLGYNQLNTLPPEFGNLTNLRTLDLDSNQLSTLPPEFGNLTNLQTLYLGGNQLNALPPEFGNLTNLQSLYMADNQLSELPSAFGNLTNLQIIYLYDNQLSGLPPEFGNLTNLRTLDMGWNQLNALPPEFGNLSNLQTLVLYGNQLSELPPEFGNLSNLQTLYLGHSFVPVGNQLSTIPPEISNLTNLQRLILNFNPLSGPLPENLTNLTQLQWFSFDDTNLCEPQDTAIQNWLADIPDVLSSGLICLDSGVCASVAEIPQTECEALVTLYNHTSGDNWSDNSDWGQTNTPCNWYGVTCDGGSVASLALNNNQLSGSIPSGLEDLTNMRELLLYENQLVGNIPSELSYLTNLEILYLSDNQLTGEIPPELGDLVNLKELWIGSNPFSGTIPIELSQLGNLLRLDLGDTQLNGSVPPELGNLTNLDVLYLWYTRLNGTLPANLTNLTALQTFYFNDTNLCEPQDTAFQSWLGGIADVQSTGTACSSFDYFVHEEYGGEPQDVDKTPEVGDDEEMCWNFSASNLLEWLGWDKSPFTTAQAIADNVKEHWENKGGMTKYLWRWWMNGTLPPDLGPEWAQASPNDPVEGHWPDEDFSAYYYSHWRRNVMEAVKDYLHSGYGVAIRLYDKEESTDRVGHALTVWGYRYHPDGTVIGLWVTDSNDAASEPPELRLLPVTYLAKWVGPNLYELKWRITEDDSDYPDWLIEGVQALKPKDANFLRVRRAGTGTGNIAGDGIDCGATCVATYQPGTPVTLTATSDDDSDFVGWEGACSGTGDCVVSVNGETQVTAIFAAQEPGTFTITVNVEPGVTVEPATEQHVPADKDATFIFSPDEASVILDVLVDGYSVGPVTSYTFTNVSEDHTIDVKTIPKNAKLAIVRKKCIKIDENGEIELDDDGKEQEVACIPGENAAIYIGNQVCDSECMRTAVPFTDGSALILKVVLDKDGFTTRFIRWEVNGEPIEEGDEDRIRYTLEDIFLGPVIGCNHG